MTSQPPSGGCVLKPKFEKQSEVRSGPAAFGRLCVETDWIQGVIDTGRPAAFGRLCVETVIWALAAAALSPAAFGRLCVETD